MSKRMINRSVRVLAISMGFLASGASAQAPDLVEIVRNPIIGNFKGYAEFKMGQYGNARAIWEALAERGNAEAHFNLGILDEDGLGGAHNLKAALAHYEKSAIAGSGKAQYRLGLLYFSGATVPRDDVKAARWLGAAAAQGDQDAAALLAQLNGASATPAQQDFFKADTLRAGGQNAQAVAIWRRLAQGGDMRSRTRLAWMLEAGMGASRDLDAAATLFRQSAQEGDAEAQYALGMMLQMGKGQALDPLQARAWWQRAALQGHRPAIAALAAPGP